MTEQLLRRAEAVVQREVAGETFLVPVRGRLADLQELFVLNEVGTWIWTHLDEAGDMDSLVAGVVAEFEVDESQATTDTESFLQQLGEAGLLQDTPPSPGE